LCVVGVFVCVGCVLLYEFLCCSMYFCVLRIFVLFYVLFVLCCSMYFVLFYVFLCCSMYFVLFYVFLCCYMNFCVVLCIFVFYVFLCFSMHCLFCVLCIVCVYMCTELLPPGGYPIAVKCIISFRWERNRCAPKQHVPKINLSVHSTAHTNVQWQFRNRVEEGACATGSSARRQEERIWTWGRIARLPFWMNIFQAVGLTVVPRHLRHYYHCHNIVLIVPLRTIPCGVVSRKEWLRVYTPTTKNCSELRKTPFAKSLHQCSDACHRWRRGASAFVSSIKMHIRIHWTCNQQVYRQLKLIMIEHC